MAKPVRDNRSYRGMLQSDDGVITRVVDRRDRMIRFESSFGLSPHMIERLKCQPEHILFSERSRIARLGIQITSEPPNVDQLQGDQLVVTQTASAAISNICSPMLAMGIGNWLARAVSSTMPRSLVKIDTALFGA